MQIQINSDKHIVGSPELAERVKSTVERELRHVADRVTRVEAHLNDVNSAKSGQDDKRCMLEVRLAGMQPLSVEHRAPTIELAVDGAAAQLARAIKATLGKVDDERRRGSIKHEMRKEE